MSADKEAAAGPAEGLVELPEALRSFFEVGNRRGSTIPRLIDLCFSVFQAAKQPNDEDGGPSDWFNDTKPRADEMVAEMRGLFAASLAGRTAEGGAGDGWRPMSEEPIGRPITARMRLGDGSWWYARVRAWRHEDGNGGRFGDHGYELLHYNGDVTMGRFYGPFDGWREVGAEFIAASSPPSAASEAYAHRVEVTADAVADVQAKADAAFPAGRPHHVGYHLLDDRPFTVDTGEGPRRLGKGWIVVTEAEFDWLAGRADARRAAPADKIAQGLGDAIAGRFEVTRRAAPAAGVDLASVEAAILRLRDLDGRAFTAARRIDECEGSAESVDRANAAEDAANEAAEVLLDAVRALVTAAGDMAPLVAAPLTADFVNAFPDGTRDESRYDEVEDALDRAEAESCGAGGRWLKLPERIAALAADRDEARARLAARGRGPADPRAGAVMPEAVAKLYEITSLVSVSGGGQPPAIHLSFANLADCHAAIDALYEIAPLTKRQERMAARIAAEDRARGAEGGEASE